MTHLRTVAASIAPRLAELTACNDHSTCALELAKRFGRKERKPLSDIRQAHHQRGHLLDSEAAERRALVNKILARVDQHDQEAAKLLRAAL